MSETNALVLGNLVFYPALFAGDKPFVFSPVQNSFLQSLQKLKNIHAAALNVGKDDAWAESFIRSKKFVTFRNQVLQATSLRNGVTLDWWYGFGRDVAQGYKKTFENDCKKCNQRSEWTEYELESLRDDDMQIKAMCPICFDPTDVKEIREKFEPTREQVVVWQEFGNRLIPKIERVHHQFEKSEIVFESEGS
jgi:hypothetical protein